MKGRFFFAFPLVALAFVVLAVSGCGGGGGSTASLDPSDVAVVGGQHISKAKLDLLLHLEKENLKAQGQPFPKAGSTAFQTLRSQAMSLLVQQAEEQIEAAKMGITVTDKDVSTRLQAIKKQEFGGSEQRYRKQLAQEGLTDANVRDEIIRPQLVSERLVDKITKSIAITPAAIHAYYLSHLSQYHSPASRPVRYILVGKNKEALATSLLAQLKSGSDATWCALAKQYSQDPSSKDKCGKATFSQGQTVPAFDKLLFSLPTKQVGKVNTPQYGWFVLQPTAAGKPAKTTPEKQVTTEIRQALLQTRKQQATSDWATGVAKRYCKGKDIAYQAGYAPSPDPCAQFVTSTATT